LGLLLALGLPLPSIAQPSTSSSVAMNDPTTITSLAQLTRALSTEERLCRSVRLEGIVCAASRSDMGIVVLQDDTGVELLELGRRAESIAPRERIRLEGSRLFLRRRELGTQISAAPVIDNDGLHGWRIRTGEVVLKAGRVPVEVDWFNCLRNFGLDASWQQSNEPPQIIAVPAVWHSRSEPMSPETDLLPGFQAQAYEGYWETVPDFDLLRPVKTGITTNCDLGLRTRDELVGLRFTGFLDVPSDGQYTFRVGSDDGGLLFIGRPEVPVSKLGPAQAPAARVAMIGEPMTQLHERQWLGVQGRVTFISRVGEGLDLELRSGVETLSVKVVDASGLDPAGLLHTSVRAVGVGRAALTADQRIVLDRLLVLDGTGLTSVQSEAEQPGAPILLRTIREVQTMRVDEARRRVPVRIRGVVTGANRGDHWISLQDDTRGIFVDVTAVSNSFPAQAEVWEVLGRTAPGNFAPIVVAEQMRLVGPGRLPQPARPTWHELANGSMDVQWVEFQGLVSGVLSNRLTMLLPEGSLEVQMENYFEPELRSYLQALVRIRGTLFAAWNATTREVQFGSLLMRNASLSVDAPPLPDPFAAPAKTARDLLLFDAQASAFRPVKVRAQVLLDEAQGLFTVDGGTGLRVLAAEAATLRPGDWIEAVGYPEIGGPSPVLRQALVRKTGAGRLPEPTILAGPDVVRKGLDSTRVRLEGKLMAMHSERNLSVLEIQSNGPFQSNRPLFVARVKTDRNARLPLRLGSKLQLTGVYAETGRNRRLTTQVEGFELLLGSPAEIVVLSQPSWWTLERLAAVVGILIVVLALAAAWITQLRRQVEQRTAQLQREMRERERAEHHHALEAERSRIARDLHDDLGSSLTEIGALASTGQRATGEVGSPPVLFDTIAGKARSSIAALDVIVWALDPEDNSLESMADYLSGFAGEYLSHSNVVCRFKIPVRLPPVMFEGRVRHELFLAVKETLNNVVRHAHASEVELAIAQAEDALEIVIADNGKGFDPLARTYGNGLKNLHDRLAKLGGRCVLESHPGRGTSVTIHLPLPATEARREVATQDTTFD
jgi:signal transduction histidine kinase